MLRALTLVIPVLIAATGVAGKFTTTGSRWFWIWNGAAVGLVIVQGVVTWRAVTSAKKARDEMKTQVYDQISPLVRRLSVFVLATPAGRKHSLESIIEVGIGAAVGLAPAQRARATLFTIATRADGVDVFVPGPTTGRGDPPVSTFAREAGDVAGMDVWQHAERDEPRFCRDTTKKPPPGWDPVRKRAYRTFITVPVKSGDALVGLLTVNAPEPGDLGEVDVQTMQVLAGLIGMAKGMC